MLKEKIKVIHLVNDLGIGGVQKVVFDICSTANLENYDIKIYSLSNKLDFLSSYHLDPRIEIKTFNYKFSESFSLFGYFKKAFLDFSLEKNAAPLVDEILKDKPNILHVHIHPIEMNLGILLQKIANCEILYTQHMLQLNLDSYGTKALGCIFRKNYNKYNLIAVSEGIRDELLKHKLVGKNKKLFLIKNKLNLRLYKPTEKRSKDFISVVYVARIGAPKAHEDLIAAWSKVNNEPVTKKLFLIGPDGMNNQIHELAKKLGVEQSIVFMGAQSEIPALLDECDFAVFPSHREGLPIALLEKMAMKIPVIASDIPQLTAIVKHNINGLVFKCGNADDLAEKIKILLHDKDLRIKLGEKARETIKKGFGSLNIAFENEKAYEEIIASNN